MRRLDRLAMTLSVRDDLVGGWDSFQAGQWRLSETFVSTGLRSKCTYLDISQREEQYSERIVVLFSFVQRLFAKAQYSQK